MTVNLDFLCDNSGQGCACMLWQVSYQEALAAIFIEGWIFIILSLTGVRQGLIRQGLLPYLHFCIHACWGC